MDFQFIKDYKDNDVYRKSFNKLAGTVFGIDFEQWYKMGFWNDRYICYSFMDNGEIISNVSASIIDLVVNGDRFPALQIGTVMTRPDYRRKGLAKKLMNIVMEECKKRCELAFLFANPDAAGFYQSFCFEAVSESTFFADICSINEYAQKNGVSTTKSNLSSDSDYRIRKLNMSYNNDIEILKRLSAGRRPHSESFGTAHTEGILRWHCLNVFPNDIYYIETLGTIVIYNFSDNVLNLYDAVCGGKPDLPHILSAIVKKEINIIEAKGIREVVFHFTPETADMPIKTRPYITDEYIFYVKSDSIELKDEFFYPFTAHA